MTVEGTVIPGHGVASGKSNDPRYMGGTIRMQVPYFKDRGLDLADYHMGTINVDISPFSFDIKQPKHYLEKIAWSEHIGPESFYFFDVRLTFLNANYEGLVYMPDPATKEEHHQKPTVLELLLPKVDGLEYDARVFMSLRDDQLELRKLSI